MEELNQLEQNEFSTQERNLERIVWRKLDRRVLPFCVMFYLLSFLVCFLIHILHVGCL